MRHRFVIAGIGSAALAAAAVAFTAVPSQPTLAAAPAATFTIPAHDGYGMSDCVASGSSCAKVVADSWCEAQGYARSASFGVEDAVAVTGSIASRAPISITCSD